MKMIIGKIVIPQKKKAGQKSSKAAKQ